MRVHFKAHVYPKDIACYIEFCTGEKYENHPIKMLELFQNNNTSVQQLLGEHGPLIIFNCFNLTSDVPSLML